MESILWQDREKNFRASPKKNWRDQVSFPDMK